MHRHRHALAVALLGAVCGAPAAPVSITTLGTSYQQNFNSLASTGTSSALPAGWEFSEAGPSSNTTYTAGTGSSNTGDTYSFGSTGSNDRALGMLQSGNLSGAFGVAFTNNTGATITGLEIAFTGEQWRSGTGANGRVDLLDFEYSTTALLLTGSGFSAFDALDFTSPVSTGSGALDGNLAANRTALGATISGLTIANGGTVWLRWIDRDATGNDDGLAIDDFSIVARGAAATAVPEPGSLALAGLALLGAARFGRHAVRTTGPKTASR